MVSPSLDQAVLIDFGLCTLFEQTEDEKEGVITDDYCGTVEYMAPEIVWNQPYQASKSDVWSLGVSIFSLIFGRFPFTVADHLSSKKNPFGSFREYVTLPSSEDHISRELKSLLCGMLRFEWEKRLSSRSVAAHPWLLNTNCT